MQALTFESNPGAQRRAAALLLLVGLAVAGFCREGLSASEEQTVRAAFWLGLLLAMIGGAMLGTGGKRIVSADTRRRVLKITVTRWGKDTLQTYPFQDIIGFDLNQWGDHEGGRPAFDVVMALRGGQRISLFGGFFDDRHDRAVMDVHRARLMALLGHVGPDQA